MRSLRRRFTAAVKGTLAGLLPVGNVQAQPENLRDFQAEVLDILKRKRPTVNATADQNVDVIEIDGGLRIGLQNIHTTVRSLPAQERRAAIGEFLDQMLATASSEEKGVRSWSEVVEFVRPRLLSADVLQVAPDLLHRPFAPGVVVGYVIDHGPGVSFINRKHAEGWAMGIEAVEETAVANLEALSASVPIDVRRPATGAGLFVAVSTFDSYEAARLLLPQFRGRLLAVLGDTVFVGIPTRDFFVAWSPDCSMFAPYLVQIGRVFRQEPRPITDSIFVFDRAGVRPATTSELPQP